MHARPAVLLLLALALPAGGASAAVPPDVEAATLAAEAAYRTGDYRGAAARCGEILADLETRSFDEAPEEQWRRTLLLLALAESTVGNAPASRTAMERVLAVDPGWVLDPDLFSPGYRREFEQARARLLEQPRLALRVSTRSGEGRAFVQGRALGEVPVEVALPAGSYRVGVVDGAEARTVTVALGRDETLVLDTGRPPPDLSARPPPVEAPVATLSRGGWIRPAAWATSGLAVAAAGVAVWQGVLAAGSYSDAQAMVLPDGSLRPGVDPAAHAAAVSAYQSQRTTAWIAGGSAVVLGAGATALWLLAPSVPIEPSPGGAAVRF